MPRTELLATAFSERAKTADTVDGAVSIADGSLGYLVTDVIDVSRRYFAVLGPNHEKEARLGSLGSQGFLDLYSSNRSLAAQIFGGNGQGADMVLSGQRAVYLDTSASTGDESVRLPTDAIRGTETLDEPGLASKKDTALYDVILPTPRSMISRTITPPADGYVLALGQAAVRIAHTQGTSTDGAIDLSDDGFNFGGAQDVNLQITSNAPSANYSLPAHGSRN